MGFIYMLTSPSTKSYIGQTTRPIKERLKEHQYSNSDCVAISRAIQKYGWDKFEKHWYEVPDEELNDHEEMMVEVLGTLAPSGYNLKEGGGSGGKLSEETKKKIGAANKGKILSEVTRGKISKAHIGKTMSVETKQKMSEASTGRTHTDETKQKMSDSKKGEKCHMYGKSKNDDIKQKISITLTGRALSDEHKKNLSIAKSGENNPMFGKSHSDDIKQKMSDAHVGKPLGDIHKQKISESLIGEKNHNSKKVYQYDIKDAFVQSFESAGEAARSLNKNTTSSICSCARGECNSAYGFKWSYTKL
ncbi:GIY-YIG catalytic domain-containing endonuclease [Acanthocystis turfacea Chlorella virus WI0606]|nr:GIY-YIG catalytic domain-containing endonuclease [Acanthocystis turfacea Chlorella virus WI0606]